MVETQTLRPAPIPTPETQGFWQAAREGRFLLPHCRRCARAYWYPRAICPFCWGDDIAWEASPGEGVVYACTVMRHGADPFVLAYVTLAEGPSMLTHLVGRDAGAWAIGDPVRLRFVPARDDGLLPVFEHAARATRDTGAAA